MSRRDFIPHSDAEFDIWFRNLAEYAAEKTSGDPVQWDHIPRRHVNELVAAYEDWRRYYDFTLQPHIPAAITAKNDARKRAERVLRPFVRRFLHFEPVTNADRRSKVLRTFELGVCA